MATSNNCVSIFSNQPGRVAAIAGDVSLFTLLIDGDSSFYEQFKAVITSIGVQQQGGYQFVYSLSDFIYLYVFNERMGEFIVTGLAFADTCEAAPNTNTGLESLLHWYEANRITARATPIIVVLGTTLSYQTFLTGFKIDVVNPENAVCQFTARFALVPNTSPNADPCGVVQLTPIPSPNVPPGGSITIPPIYTPGAPYPSVPVTGGQPAYTGGSIVPITNQVTIPYGPGFSPPMGSPGNLQETLNLDGGQVQDSTGPLQPPTSSAV